MERTWLGKFHGWKCSVRVMFLPGHQMRLPTLHSPPGYGLAPSPGDCHSPSSWPPIPNSCRFSSLLPSSYLQEAPRLLHYPHTPHCRRRSYYLNLGDTHGPKGVSCPVAHGERRATGERPPALATWLTHLHSKVFSHLLQAPNNHHHPPSCPGIFLHPLGTRSGFI